ncbi:MAG: penicillin acylase family protein [Caldilineaceae bacterium]|nr:penicillin acylase family protein [Caldilineaceae bacterium]MCB9122084.1 penicillin acylase family protein [Caldilineaceae bacterium]
MRKFLLGLLAVVLALLVLVPLGGYFWLRTSLPLTTGTVRVAGVDGPIEIVRDADGVPHIFAGTDHDAFYGLGYVHAQDRLWQMEMNRRIGAGRLSEILGDATLSIDKFQRTMGYYRAALGDLEVIEPRSRQALDAYAAGVNQRLSEGHTLPPEFILLGVSPEPWQPADSLVWQKMMSWDLGGNYDMELLRQQLAQALGPERTAQLLAGYPADGIDILAGVQIDPGAAAALLEIDRRIETDFARGGRESGSNDWVIAGARTETGMPLLADDPHLGTSIPSIWYLAEIQGDTIHSIGSTFPGLPAIVIGHNEQIAWGVTNVGPDVQDLYVERINPANPNQYEVDGAWADMTIAEELIAIDGEEEPLRWAARATRHGPLISDVSDMGSPLALQWTALQPGDTTIDAFLGVNYASDWEEFTAAMEKFITPSQNFVFADVEGNIGYFAPGRIPIRAAGHDGTLPVPGWASEYEWQGFIPFAELPQTYNPPEGYVATANNRVVGDDYPYLLSTDWAPPYRAERITELIEQMSSGGEKISADDMAAIQADQTSTQVRALLPFLLSVAPADERQAQANALLQGFDGTLAMESTAAAIYAAWMLHLERAIFEDDLRATLFEEMSTRANPLFLTNVLNDPVQGAAWCDNVLTPAVEPCAEIAQVALDNALDDLSERMGDDMGRWRWDRIHITQYPHNPFSQVSYLKGLFHRTIPNGGDRYTVNVAPVNLTNPYVQTHSPGYRHIVDLSDLPASRFMITTGQSGNVLSPHYDDLITRHRDVAYLPMRFGRENVTGDTLRLEAQ